MFTANYDKYKKLMFMGDTNFYYAPEINAGNGFVWTTGAELGTSLGGAPNSYNGDIGYWLNKGRVGAIPTTTKSSVTDATFGVYFGTGATPATKDDYTLESPITSGMTVTNYGNTSLVDFIYTEDEHGNQTFSVPYVLNNTSGAEINVYEIGVITPISSNGATVWPVLMERTVLPEPVTIPAGESRMITYSVHINKVLSVE